MPLEALNLKIVLILTIGFAYASILGYLAHRVKLSPIIGYIIAGFLIGPYSPGFVASLETAEELAEIGVILMMFGTGLHLKWEDLLSVKYIAITGAVVQTVATSLIAAVLIYYLGWSLAQGVIIGLAISVASTIVLVRVLADHHLLKTTEGHIKIGWVIVEDVITVIMLIFLPIIGLWIAGDPPSPKVLLETVGLTLLKMTILIFLSVNFIPRIASYIISKAQQTRSHELFILTVMSLTFVLATGSTLLFGTSIALGAFLAGIIIRQTEAHKKVDNNVTPLKDIFVVIFFLSVGMLFNPHIIVEDFALFMIVLAIILIVKPFFAIVTSLMLKQPFLTALSVGIVLAQIGEFSFILAQQATNMNLLSDQAFDILVACSIVSISLNPIIFRYFRSHIT